ncbi:MAG: FmdE family protein [Candidatus Ozemobacteraceae bacterium]
MLTIDNQIILSEEAYKNGLKKAEAFHGHLCPGMFTGVKMALLAQNSRGTKGLVAGAFRRRSGYIKQKQGWIVIRHL